LAASREVCLPSVKIASNTLIRIKALETVG
jgi:hypothetical protein